MRVLRNWKTFWKVPAILALLYPWLLLLIRWPLGLSWDRRWLFESVAFNLDRLLLALLIGGGVALFLVRLFTSPEKARTTSRAMTAILVFLFISSLLPAIYWAVQFLPVVSWYFAILWSPMLLTYCVGLLISLPYKRCYPYAWAIAIACLLSVFINSLPREVDISTVYGHQIPWVPTTLLVSTTAGYLTWRLFNLAKFKDCKS